MTYNNNTILQLCDMLDISYDIRHHEPLFTVYDAEQAMGKIEGMHIRNLFLRDKKKNYYLLTIEKDTRIDLKQCKTLLGAQGNLSFGHEDMLAQYLGVKPGAVTPLALANIPTDVTIKFIMDIQLYDTKIIHVHPLRNDMSVAIYNNGLHKFFTHCQRVSTWVDFVDYRIVMPPPLSNK